MWSFAPTSRAGAGTYGGRANRPGLDALYLSLELETALAEYQRLDALMPPGLMVSYKVSIDPIVDFRGGFSSSWDELWQEFYCDWRKLHFHLNMKPPSWIIGDRVHAAGAKGILFDSTIANGTNLVIYTDSLTGADSVEAYDPNNALPKNQLSWK
jgi:RES domain-containing protein